MPFLRRKCLLFYSVEGKYLVLADELGQSIACLIKRRSVAGKGHSSLRLLMCERAIKTIKLGKECFLAESSYTYCLPALVGGGRNELADFVGRDYRTPRSHNRDFDNL